ncbi:multidrug efflux pump [Cryptococcus neoformans Tu401-1]|nr:multidrug efflux pump [Cryptococcus neoformans var. grubii Tu401-1]OXM79702.1 multidrug efflux pump [Cryptococcus neoformans var. grubii Bt63]
MPTNRINQKEDAFPSIPSNQPVLENNEDEYRPLPHVWSGATLCEPWTLSGDKLKSVNSVEPLYPQAHEREPEENAEVQGNEGLTREAPASSSFVEPQENYIPYSSGKGPNMKSDLPGLYNDSAWPESAKDSGPGPAQNSKDEDQNEKPDDLNASTIPIFPSANTSLPPLTPSQSYLRSRSSFFRLAFLLITCATQLIVQVQLGMVMMPLHATAEWLGKDNNSGEMSWMAASYGLTVGMFLVMAGRLGDIYGPRLIWAVGCTFMIVCNIGSGFATSAIGFDIARAVAGIGSALALPNALAILGRTYPPGQTRNMVFSILGALAPAGFWIGGVIGGLFAQFAHIKWVWWFTAILIALFLGAGFYVLPPDSLCPSVSKPQFDTVGAILLSLTLGLFNFVWNQAPLVSWSAAYIPALLVVSLIFGGVFVWWERRVGKGALIPMEVLSKQSLLVYLSLWLGWMSYGTFLLYTTFFIYDIRGYTEPLTMAFQLTPLLPAGIIAALIVPFLIRHLPNHFIFLLSMFAFTVCNIIAATASTSTAEGQYWKSTFWSLVIGTFGPDMSFSTGQLIVSNSVSHEFQGIAAGVVSMITNYSYVAFLSPCTFGRESLIVGNSIAIGLGLTGTLEYYIRGSEDTIDDRLRGYRASFWFATGLASIAGIVVALFVRMPKQTGGLKDVHAV